MRRLAPDDTPYQDSADVLRGFFKQIDSLDPEALVETLYQDVFNHLCVGYNIYPVCTPFLQELQPWIMNEKEPLRARIVFDFLAYLFHCEYRDICPLIYQPVRYSPGYRAAYHPSFTFYRQMLIEYFSRRNQSEHFILLYLLHSPLISAPDHSSIVQKSMMLAKGPELAKNALVSLFLDAYLSPGYKSPILYQIGNARALLTEDSWEQAFYDLFVFGRADVSLIERLLLNERADPQLQFCCGLSQVLLLDAYLLNNSILTVDTQMMQRVIELHKRNYFSGIAERNLEFPLYPYLMEDLSSVLINSDGFTQKDELFRMLLTGNRIYTHEMFKNNLYPDKYLPGTTLHVYDYMI